MSNELALQGDDKKQVVDTRYTQDVIPVLDTSKFEHMQRIAQVMAHTAMLPDSLRFANSKDKKDPFTSDVLVATCFRIVNQAVRWGLDPFAVSDCASLIKGRLSWEGKLVHAVIAAKLHINLHYEIFDKEKGRNMGVIVSGTLPGEHSARTITGQVKDWNTGSQGAWASEGSWERQLRYRGAREWARAHAPHILLGVYVDDELEGMAALDVPSGQRAQRLKDVTPPKPQLSLEDLPDIPDEEPKVEDVSQDDEVLEDDGHDGFLAMLRAKMIEGDPEEVWSEMEDVIGELPRNARDKAESIYAEFMPQAAE